MPRRNCRSNGLFGSLVLKKNVFFFFLQKSTQRNISSFEVICAIVKFHFLSLCRLIVELAFALEIGGDSLRCLCSRLMSGATALRWIDSCSFWLKLDDAVVNSVDALDTVHADSG